MVTTASLLLACSTQEPNEPQGVVGVWRQVFNAEGSECVAFDLDGSYVWESRAFSPTGRPSDGLFAYMRMIGRYQLPADSLILNVQRIVSQEYHEGWSEPRVSEVPGTFSWGLTIGAGVLQTRIGNGEDDSPLNTLSLLSRDPDDIELCGPRP